MNEGTRGTWKIGELLFGIGKAAGRLLSNAGYPTSGASGTAAGRANPSSLLFDTTNGYTHQNSGSLASPVWVMQPATVRVTLTNAQIKAIRATPITAVAAQGAGTIILPISAYVGLVYGGTNAFTAAANDNLSLKLKDGSGSILLSGAVQAFVQATNSAISQMVPGSAVGATVNVSKANGDNQPLVIHNQTAAEIAGNAAADNTMVVTITYVVLQSGL